MKFDTEEKPQTPQYSLRDFQEIDREVEALRSQPRPEGITTVRFHWLLSKGAVEIYEYDKIKHIKVIGSHSILFKKYDAYDEWKARQEYGQMMRDKQYEEMAQNLN
jgi:hypothetical protein